MDIDNTIEAFKCCTQVPPDCKHCPLHGPTPDHGETCRKEVKIDVFHWLNEAKKVINRGK